LTQKHANDIVLDDPFRSYLALPELSMKRILQQKFLLVLACAVVMVAAFGTAKVHAQD